jgi:small lipoprotein (TIGR04454 family)
MKKLYIFILFLLAISLINCGKDKVKPSADSLTATEALNNIKAVKTAFEAKDMNTLKSRMSQEAVDIIGQLNFDSVELSFTPKLVTINGSTVRVNLNWIGKWVINKKDVKNRGISVFVLEGSPLKIVRVEGDNPFHIPVIRD